MKNLSCFAIFSLLVFPAGRLFAQGGACPAGANYANPASALQAALPNAPVTLAALGVTSCFYISAAGTDTNAGTSESSPWAHAPGMPNCSGNCAKVAPTGGEGFIFHGGDTWHFGNSGATPSTGGTWTFIWSGSSGSPIYLGVDPGWHAGSSWARPILTGDNPLTPHPGVWGDSVSSCPYQIGSSATNNMFVVPASYVDFDNFEMTGICEPPDQSVSSIIDIYFVGNSASNVTASNLYIHGWTHVPFACITTYPLTGTCNAIFGFYGGGAGVSLFQDVVDGSDSDPGGSIAVFISGGVTQNSVFRYTAGYTSTACHVIANNLFEYIYDPADGEAHGNIVECLGEASGLNAYYNNLVRHTYPSGIVGVNWWIGPSPGTTDYVFNNVFYDIGDAGNYLNINSRPNPQGPTYAFNNTLQSSIGDTLMSCGQAGGTYVYASNNHFINPDGSSPFYDPGSCQSSTNLVQSNATANGQGYNASTLYAYSPGGSSGPTIGVGTNLTNSYCSALSGSSDPLIQVAGTACQKDTGYSCTYNSTAHRVVCPGRGRLARPGGATAWSVGAYQSGMTPNPPTNTKATPQ
jgi:hypothetical protein